MQITSIISYRNAWTELQRDYQIELQDIIDCLPAFFQHIKTNYNNVDRTSPRVIWEMKLEKKGWNVIDKPYYSQSGQKINIGRLIGPVKNGISATVGVSSLVIHDLSRWLFHETTLAIKHGVINIPILLVPALDLAEGVKEQWYYKSNFNAFYRQLDLLSPLSHPYKFVIASYSNQTKIDGIEVFDIEPDSYVTTNTIIDKCIEFPSEYHQAGLSILNFFGTYLRENYPEEEAKVKIEQDGLKVRLIIEKEDGESEVIEKALHEYELIIKGIESPEKFTQNERLILDLRNELRMASFRIESQRDINKLQTAQIDKLMGIIGEGLVHKTPIMIDLRQTVSTTNNVIINENVSAAIADINELKNQVSYSSPAFLALNELEGSLETIENKPDKKTVKRSPAMSKFRRIIQKVQEGNNDLAKAVKAAESGIEIFKDLAGKYNNIAEWCGLPQVPSIFTK